MAEEIRRAEAVDLEAGSPTAWRRRPTFRDPGRLGAFANRSPATSFSEPRHFLDECSLCKNRIAANKDVYMYMGNIPFCSEWCRAERMEMDEAKERSEIAAIKVSSRKEQQRKAKEQMLVRRTDAVAVS